LILGDLVPKLKLEQPLIFNNMLAEAEMWEEGFVVHTPDSTYPSFIGDLLDQHFPDRDKTEYLGPEITDEDIFRDLLAGEYVTPLDIVTVLEHKKPVAEVTSFISLKSAFIGLSEGERDYTILPIPKVEDTPS
jgi:hypothetical protein